MEKIITFNVANDKHFAETITRENMASYYHQLGMVWDTNLYEKSWQEFDNYEIALDDIPVGVLRLWFEDNVCYIRDLQINQPWQNKSIGSCAVKKAISIAQKADVEIVRLRVFKTNPARALYERLGFVVVSETEIIFQLEYSISGKY